MSFVQVVIKGQGMIIRITLKIRKYRHIMDTGLRSHYITALIIYIATLIILLELFFGCISFPKCFLCKDHREKMKTSRTKVIITIINRKR